MTGIFFGVVSSVASAVVGAAAGSSITYLLSRRQRRVERTPTLLFEFADLPEHDNLGAVGFRNIENKLELLISGTVRNVGPALARERKARHLPFPEKQSAANTRDLRYPRRGRSVTG